MNIFEKRVNALCAVATAENPEEREKAVSNLRELMGLSENKQTDPEYIIREIFLDLGAPDHLLGYEYALSAILLVLETRKYIDNITFMLYPQLAVNFSTTSSRVERGIRHLIEATFDRGNMEVIDRYFGNTVSPERGRPTNGEFIARIANVVRLRMKDAA